jgi:SAM-dependent methyltransferase
VSPQDLTYSEKLNIGCGNDILEGYVNLDIAPLPGVDVVHDITKFPWPFESDSFTEVRLINVLEHLPDTVKTIEEVWRISKDSARIVIRVPYWNCWQSFADPTHKRLFHQRTFDFFDPTKKACQERPYYSKARFRGEKVHYWFPIVHFAGGRGWVKASNKILKGLLSLLANYLNNIIWVLEFELIALKDDQHGIR